MERTNVYLTDDQREWLIKNSITSIAKRWGHEGKTQSDHIRAAIDLYIKNEKNKLEKE